MFEKGLSTGPGNKDTYNPYYCPICKKGSYVPGKGCSICGLEPGDGWIVTHKEEKDEKFEETMSMENRKLMEGIRTTARDLRFRIWDMLRLDLAEEIEGILSFPEFKDIFDLNETNKKFLNDQKNKIFSSIFEEEINNKALLIVREGGSLTAFSHVLHLLYDRLGVDYYNHPAFDE